MTSKEITKSLKRCIKRSCYKCERLKNDIRKERDCRLDLMRISLGLIARQQAEIERLEEQIVEVSKTIKSEAVKEFAERLKNKIEIDLSCGVDSAYYLDDVLFNDIDNLAKEIVGTKNEN